MSLQINGIIKTVLPIEKGTSKAGAEWQKQSFIVANNDGYENKEQIFCFEVFGEEKTQNFNKFNKVGDSVTVDFNISTNEWNGKYFTSLQSWKVSKSIKEEGSFKNFEPTPNTHEDAGDRLDDGMTF